MRTDTATRQHIVIGLLAAAAVAVAASVAFALVTYGAAEPIIVAPGPVTGLIEIPAAHI